MKTAEERDLERETDFKAEMLTEDMDYPRLSEDEIALILEKEKKSSRACHTCHYWAYRLPSLGECRINPPDETGRFPFTHFQSWCGSYVRG